MTRVQRRSAYLTFVSLFLFYADVVLSVILQITMGDDAVAVLNLSLALFCVPLLFIIFFLPFVSLETLGDTFCMCICSFLAYCFILVLNYGHCDRGYRLLLFRLVHRGSCRIPLLSGRL